MSTKPGTGQIKQNFRGELSTSAINDPMVVELDELMRRFRLASRDLFNHFFHTPDPWNDSQSAWTLERRFAAVEKELFQRLVLEPASISPIPYHDVQTSIRVELRGLDVAPIMLNRELNSGYWDHPIKEVTREAVLLFVQFFDWDSLSYRDNRYVRAYVKSWPSHPEVVGKHALLDCHNVQFVQLIASERSRSNG